MMSSASNGEDKLSNFPSVVELNVGGVFYTTSLKTLTSDPNSLLGQLFMSKVSKSVPRDSKGKFFIDRDGVLFRYVLDFLRNHRLMLPENFHERERLRQEAEYFILPAMVDCIPAVSSQVTDSKFSELDKQHHKPPGFITVGYRGTFAFGRDGLADVKFRKLTRLLVCGKVGICREVFGETLNESRDPDRCNDDRYTARFFLKHNFLEQAFDCLQDAGFQCVGAAGSGTSCNGSSNEPPKPGQDSEENRWNHFNEFVFCRP
ncbi:BTB/POZ domain-containing protein KCTD12-like [Limulus polyphemus]|uniref:BTB/POZ domain-containing protein KCTD12-like n=1 Tax=Limulus polyphemus TaxID=6850 RepID=A0ABM1RW60_LIMPO|nr:BTB/POZ domain-containing protein KCTD12-like [Limulus polyphemus]